MSKSAPDTRNKIDSQKDMNRKKPVLKKRGEIVEKKPKREKKPMGQKKVEGFKAPEVSNGQVFKQQHGYSKSMKRAMLNAGLDINNFSDSLASYREIRKGRKKAQAKIKKDKHMKALAARRGKASSTKGQPAKKAA